MSNEARELDAKFPCTLRSKFSVPTFHSMGLKQGKSAEVTYLCGNSLGLMPRAAKTNVDAELNAWAGEGVFGHHVRYDNRDPWVSSDTPVAERLARLVFGCEPSEIAYTGTLTNNLNSMLQTFYQPTPTKHKLLCEAKAFPSDNYCFQNQVRLHGFDPEDSIILAFPREGEHCLRTEDILDLIQTHGDELALVCLSAVQFYTGQYFDIPAITAATKAVGATSGWDLAHAAGNVELRLHEWGLDFAVFCSYKYLNSGPGNLGGLFVHSDASQRLANEPRPAGWWGVDVSTRFDMEYAFVPGAGARGFIQSNCNFVGPACMHASLDIFEEAGGVAGLTPRRLSLTGYMLRQLRASKHYGKVFVVMTDKLPEEQKGCQLSLMFLGDESLMPRVVEKLTEKGIIGDERKPSVLRWAPTPLYNTHAEIHYATTCLEKILDSLI